MDDTLSAWCESTYVSASLIPDESLNASNMRAAYAEPHQSCIIGAVSQLTSEFIDRGM